MIKAGITVLPGKRKYTDKCGGKKPSHGYGRKIHCHSKERKVKLTS